MKKIILFLICAALLAACKKNGSSPKTILLSKTLVDGHLETEFTYNSNGQLVTENYYDEQSPFALSYRSEYIYDAAGNLKEMKGYDMPANKLNQHNVFTVDAQGRMVRNTYYSVNGLAETFSTHIDFTYNPKGRVIKQIWRDEDENIETWRNMEYYPNGNMRTSESWLQYGGPPAEKGWASSYGPSDTTLPASFYAVKAYPVNFYFSYMTSSYIIHYTYDENGKVDGQWREEMTGKQFNARGLVTQETITRKQIIPAGSEDVRVLQFEYIEQ
jgi:YD repeat-containing protein